MSSHKIDSIKERIFQSAEVLLSEVGDSFTMEELVNKTSVSRATIYRHVGNKEMLLKSLAQSRGIAFEELTDVRTRILQAARKVFGKRGLYSCTMEQIADEAGVGVATVYRHFGDKDNLVWTFINEMSPRTIAQNLLLEISDDITSDLKNFAITILPSFYENRDIMRLILANHQAEKVYIEKLRKGSDKILDLLANYFQSQIRAGNLQDIAQPQELALTFMGMIFSFTVFAPVHHGIELDDSERIGSLIVQIFLDGIKT
ncbi:TetR family transcriptional regulator protein [Calothrix parasitica NIES-267]|uniref:TetR family transcriptional regulator protein n=1 Tax=Calothrix parasitica NIES-267 TaxID=1973488 RepID=A0A1Z4M0L6_9CYAN|nr:TetR family transcriptional regulator protein [Calothrix parasitica NIES-267]